jgi:NadR type nicotinamide-nucleotide adenylyltransferase
MKKFRTGLVVGKFSPLHKGHDLVIQAAIKDCDEVIILSYSSPEFKRCEADQRKKWLHDQYGHLTKTYVEILVIPPGWFELPDGTTLRVPDNDDTEEAHRRFCAKILLEHFETSVDAVFTSETYGDGFAKYLTEYFAFEIKSSRVVEHVCVDLNRGIVPTSGTECRADPKKLAETFEVVQASFVPRIAILGGESSGKTTLAKALAEKLGWRQKLWVPEFGRTYCDIVGGVQNLRYRELEAIALEQIAQEEQYARLSIGNILVCDTTPLTTRFYSEQLFGRASRKLIELSHRKYDYTILCQPTIPFEQDGTRFDEGFRDIGHQYYVKSLLARGIEFGIVWGSVDHRVQQVLEYIKS